MSQKVGGNIRGLAPSEVRAVHKLFLRSLEPADLVDLDFARELYAIALKLRRRIGALVTREGRVVEVFIGTNDLLYLPDLGRYRLGAGRLRRLRLIFSDLSADRSKVNIPSDIYTDLEKLRLDMVVGVKTVGNRTSAAYAYVLPVSESEDCSVRTESVADLGRLKFDFAGFVQDLETQHSDGSTSKGASQKKQAVLVGVYPKRNRQAQASMEELRELARTAGVEVLDTIVQSRELDPKTLLGKGKLEEVLLRCLRVGAELAVFDTELKPSQWRAITNSTDLAIIDRSMLILDIFAQRARSSEGRLQVELAQLKYNLPRLVEKDAGLSRLIGGIGGRGPGETKLEIGRRRIRARIRELERRIDKIGRQRELKRRRRRFGEIPLVAVMGYTNVGKSTLFNALARSDALIEDKLFATLDTSQRRIWLGDAADSSGSTGRVVVLSDTVGFIRDLPKELLNAFRATLEELRDATLLVHVLDAADPEIQRRKESVERVLADLELADIPQLLVINKCDLVDPSRALALQREFGGICVSALRCEGIDLLRSALTRWFSGSPEPVGAAPYLTPPLPAR